MLLSLAFHQSGLWRPVVAVEHTAPQKLVEPRPFRIAVVIGRGVESNPSAAVLHVFLKCLALFSTTWRSVQADNDAVLLQLLVGIVGQRGGDIQNPSLAVSQFMKELYGLFVELYMGLFGSRFVVQEGFEAWGTGIVGGVFAVFLCGKDCREAKGCNHQHEFLETCVHIFYCLSINIRIAGTGTYRPR